MGSHRDRKRNKRALEYLVGLGVEDPDNSSILKSRELTRDVNSSVTKNDRTFPFFEASNLEVPEKFRILSETPKQALARCLDQRRDAGPALASLAYIQGAMTTHTLGYPIVAERVWYENKKERGGQRE